MAEPTIGIIGGGQLGSMLCTAAKNLNIKTIVISDDKNAATLATSEGSPNLFEGIFAKINSLNFSSILSVIFVFIKPGEIQLILIFFFAYSRAKLLLIPIMPDLEAA